jgi:hypothetical protein
MLAQHPQDLFQVSFRSTKRIKDVMLLTFELPLERLRHIVRDLQRHSLIHNDIHLHVVLLPRMVRATCIDFLDPVVMRHDQVDQLANEVLRCRLANEKPDVIKGVRGPRNEDQETDQNGTDGVDKPSNTATDDGHGETESIDDDVVPMVDEEDVNGGVSPEEKAVYAERAFAENCCGDEGNWDDVQFFRFFGPAGKRSTRFYLDAC